MLVELKVSNFAIINEVHISFDAGLNILSGETGAGKSVLLKSLSLLMGAKSTSDIVRAGKSQASVQGCFDISERPDIRKKVEEMGLTCPDDLLIFRRIISKDSKSRVYINDSLTTLSALQSLVTPMLELAGSIEAPLIEMTSQHESKNLLSKGYHLDMVDKYAGLFEKRAAYQKKYNEWKEVLNQIEELNTNSQNRAQRVDFLEYQVKEIEDVNLQPGEETEIAQKFDRLKNLSKVSSFFAQAEEILDAGDSSISSQLQNLIKSAKEQTQIKTELAPVLESLQSALIQIEDSAFTMKKLTDSLTSEEEDFESVEDRMADIRKLQRKYGQTSEEILQVLEDLTSELEQLKNFEATLSDLTRNADNLEKDLLNLAKDLHSRRTKAAKVFIDSVNNELKELNMKGVTFSVVISEIKNRDGLTLTPTGYSDVQFATKNPGDGAPIPLNKAASGGELSRILLSIKNVVGDHDAPRTYLFDEVDTGVSGTTAEKVGRKLKSIADGQQVICVTHLPQVAAFADVHFFINKEDKKKSGSEMTVTALKKDDRVNEIARLISGEKITKTSLEHAKELLR